MAHATLMIWPDLGGSGSKASRQQICFPNGEARHTSWPSDAENPFSPHKIREIRAICG
jgi:hypothetical protein